MANEKGGKKSQKKEATKVEVKEVKTESKVDVKVVDPITLGRETAYENAAKEASN